MNISLNIYYLSPSQSPPLFLSCKPFHKARREFVTGAHREIYLTHFEALFPDDKEGVSVVYFKLFFFGIIFVSLDDTGVFRKLGQSTDFRRSPAQRRNFQNSGR